MKTISIQLFLLGLLFGYQSFSQVIINEKPYEINVGTNKVFVFATYSDNPDFHPYYYLPTNLHVSYKNGVPEFSFISYKKDENSDIEGGLMHFLLSWGLNSEQDSTLNVLFRQKADSLGTLMGAMNVTAQAFEITTDKPIAKVLRKTLSSTAKVPSYAGGKMAVSFRLDGEETKAIQKAIQNPKSVEDINLEFRFTYNSSVSEKTWKISMKLSDLFTTIKAFPQCIR